MQVDCVYVGYYPFKEAILKEEALVLDLAGNILNRVLPGKHKVQFKKYKYSFKAHDAILMLIYIDIRCFKVS